MPEWIWYLVSPVLVGVVTFFVTALNEGRRQRLTSNFERKQQHYADLYETLYKLTTAMDLHSTNTLRVPNTFDISKIENDLDSKDLLRIDALNQIWASKDVQVAVAVWTDQRNLLLLMLSAFPLSKSLTITTEDLEPERAEAESQLARLKSQLDEILRFIRKDLLISSHGIEKTLAKH